MENKNKYTLINNNNIKSTKSHKNRIKNWSAYNNGLVNRGNFTFLIEKSLLEPPKQTGKAGHPFVYPDALILVLAELREFTQLQKQKQTDHLLLQAIRLKRSERNIYPPNIFLSGKGKN